MPNRLGTGACQGTVVIFPTLVAFEVVDGLEFTIASLVIRKFTWAVDHVPVTARCAVIDQYGEAVAPNTARLALVLELATRRLFLDQPLFALLGGAGGGWLDMPDARCRRGQEAAFNWPTWQQRALIGRACGPHLDVFAFCRHARG